jgi:hypothetical protein
MVGKAASATQLQLCLNGRIRGSSGANHALCSEDCRSGASGPPTRNEEPVSRFCVALGNILLHAEFVLDGGAAMRCVSTHCYACARRALAGLLFKWRREGKVLPVFDWSRALAWGERGVGFVPVVSDN